MVWIDIVILIIILWFSYKGYKNGIISELAALLALILAIWAALKHSSFANNILKEQFNITGDYVPYLGFILTFIVVLLIVGLLGKLLTRLLGMVQLGIANRLLGLLFSATKICLILSLIINGLDRINTHTEFIKKETINESYLYLPLNRLAQKIYEFSDEHIEGVKNVIDHTFDSIDKKIENLETDSLKTETI